MNYYMLRIKCGKNGDDDPDRIRKFIESSNLVGIGAPEETRGSDRFEHLTEGEHAVVLSQSLPLAFVEIIDNESKPFTLSETFPDFNWLELVRKVRVISWYEDDKDRLSLPTFPPNSWGPGTFKLVDGNRDLIEQWHGAIMNEQTMKLHSDLLCEIQDLVGEKLQVILTGAPGTGKTYLAQEVAAKMILGAPIDSADRIEEALEKAGKRVQYQFVQFHPGYDYSDFVEGIKPRVEKNTSAPEFSLEEGIFKKFCAAAAVAFDGAEDKKTAPKFVMVIDEINRADLSRVFGELFFGLEKDYRGKEIRTQYDYLKRVPGSDALKEGFSRFVIPPNLYIIGTMNDIDRSVESMDFALRRRFGWREISWEESLAIIDAKIPTASNPELNSATRRIMAAVNNVIIKDKMELEPAFALGGAYFKDAAEKSWDDLWKHSIRIILNEYLRGNRCEKSIEDIEKIWKEEVNKVVPGIYESSVTTEHSDNVDEDR